MESKVESSPNNRRYSLISLGLLFIFPLSRFISTISYKMLGWHQIEIKSFIKKHRTFFHPDNPFWVSMKMLRMTRKEKYRIFYENRLSRRPRTGKRWVIGRMKILDGEYWDTSIIGHNMEILYSDCSKEQMFCRIWFQGKRSSFLSQMEAQDF